MIKYWIVCEGLNLNEKNLCELVYNDILASITSQGLTYKSGWFLG